MFNFNADLGKTEDDYNKAIDYLQEIYKIMLIVSIRGYLAKEYPTFTGNIYFEVNRDFLSIAVNPYFENTANADLLSNDLHKHLCTLSPNLLQCLDDVTITI